MKHQIGFIGPKMKLIHLKMEVSNPMI